MMVTLIELLDINVGNILITQDGLLCTDTFSKVHSEQINDIHEHIILALLDYSSNSISICKLLVYKVMPGCNRNVDNYFQYSLLWHNIWKANGEPSEGLIADLRCKTWSEYHKVCKMLISQEGEIKSDEMAEAFSNNHIESFWRGARQLHLK